MSSLKDLKQVLGWAHRSQSAPRINAMIDLARSEPGIAIDPRQLDANPWLLNVPNGTVDLRESRLTPHDQADLLTKLAGADYRPEATAPTWDRFLERIMDGKTDLIGYLRRAVGYSLTATVGEQCLFFLHGGGQNGKSVFLGAIQHVLGDYAGTAAPDLLMVRYGEAHPTQLADLHGKRFISTIEVEDGRRLAESLVKQLTGGDIVKARRMREDFYEFAPTWKIWLAANAKPEIRGQDHAIWRRIRLIPFNVTIPETERDRALLDKLKLEDAGILAWAVRGCLEWQERGLAEPDEVRAATESYRGEQDRVREWLEECCVTGSADYRFRKSEAYAAFSKWMADQGERCPSGKRFGMELRRLGITEDDGKRWYVGMAKLQD